MRTVGLEQGSANSSCKEADSKRFALGAVQRQQVAPQLCCCAGGRAPGEGRGCPCRAAGRRGGLGHSGTAPGALSEDWTLRWLLDTQNVVI